MRKPVLAILFSAISLASLAATSATAMPIAAPVAPTTSAEQVRWICNVWGRCWWQPDYYRRYGYYGYRYGDDDWPYGYGLSARLRLLRSALGRLRLASRMG
jgi:hypothetical protein